ncbi:hypothetical protein Tco_1252733 [Tanacetum coccineum]
MVESLPTMVDTHIKEQVKKQVPEQVRDQVPVYVAEGLILERQKTKEEMERVIAKAILQERGNIQAKISSQIQKSIDNRIPSQVDASIRNDDEVPTKQVSQDIMKEVSLTIDEAKLKKMADEMLRQRCTSRDEHQYHINQMKNFLKSDVVWESRKEILVSPYLRKTTPLKRSSRHEKIVLSLYKFPAIIFNDDDIEERTSRWVNKCVKKFNPYARYGVEHWKNPHAKIFYIKKQKEHGKPKEEVCSNSKIIQVIKTYWELGHEHKFITEIVARRANECIVLITEPDYKNLNKNDIKDMYLLIMNGKVPDYAETGLLWSLSVLIRKSYGYIQRDLTNEEVEYLKLFEEEIEVSKSDEKMGDHSLYGLKQASHAWFQHFAGYATRICFQQTSSAAFLQRVIASLHGEFSMKYLGSLNYFLEVNTESKGWGAKGDPVVRAYSKIGA